MSVVKVTTIIEISGPMVEGRGNKPSCLTYVHTQSATGGDNERFYGNAVRDAVTDAFTAVVEDVRGTWPLIGDVNKV